MGKKHSNLSSYGLIKKIVKQKCYSTGTVMLCEINPTLYAVLVYDAEGNLTASCCNDIGHDNSVKKKSLKLLNKTFKDIQEKLSKKELVKN